jgi:hypothetical protein
MLQQMLRPMRWALERVGNQVRTGGGPVQEDSKAEKVAAIKASP